MTKKICKGICLVSGIVLLFSVIITLGISYAYYDSTVASELENEITYIEHGINSMSDAYLDGLPKNGDTRITLIDTDGSVIYDSHVENILDNHIEREEVKEAFETGFGSSSRYSDTLSEETVYIAKRLDDGRVVRVAHVQVTWIAIFLNMLFPILIVFVITVGFAFFLAVQISKRIVSPLNKIDLDNAENTEVYDELAPMLERIVYQNNLIKKQISELERKQTEFNTITDNMKEGMIIIDNRAEILSHNSSAIELLEADGDGEHKSVLTLNRNESFRRAISSALMGERKESIIKSNSGHIRIIATPVKNQEATVGVVILILDETEKINNEKIRREFTSNVSHELKTPLTSISGFAELMKNGMVSEKDTAHFADNIYNEAQRLITLVNDIIKLSKLDEKAGMSDIDKFDLSLLANEVCDRFSLVLQKQNITLNRNISSDVEIEGNPKIIDEIIYNLCDNAIKYNKDRGCVTVSLSCDDESATLSVSDTGIGIPKALQERVFERFYRVDKSHSKEIGGTGLGLSIVKRGVIYHNATLTIDSELEKGTTINIKFSKKFNREF